MQAKELMPSQFPHVGSTYEQIWNMKWIRRLKSGPIFKRYILHDFRQITTRASI